MIPRCCCKCVLFLDIFPEDGSLDPAWQSGSGTWSVSSGRATVSSPSTRDHVYVAPADAGSWPAVESRMQATTDGDELGLLFYKHTSSGAMAYAILKVHSSSAFVKLYHWDGSSTETLLDSAPVTAAAGEYHKLRVCVNDASGLTQVLIYLNDDLILSYRHTGFGFPPLPISGAAQAVGPIVRSISGTPTWEWIAFTKSDTTKCPCYPCTVGNLDADFQYNGLTSLYRTSGGTWDIAAGKMKATPGAGTVCLRCTIPPTDLDGIVFVVESNAHHTAYDSPGIIIHSNSSISAGTQSIVLRLADTSDPFGTPGYNWTLPDGSNGIVAGSPSSGDLLGIRVTDTSSGAGTYTIEFLVNSSVIKTSTSVSLDLTLSGIGTAARPMFWWGFFCGGTAGDQTWDNSSITYS